MLELPSIDPGIDHCFEGNASLERSLDKQEEYLARRKKGQIKDTVLFFELNDCYTTGRLTSYTLNPELDIRVLDRAGGPTYHGPGQLVCYPVIAISAKQELRSYSRWLEQLAIKALANYGLQGYSKDGLAGVWIGDRKIGFIGAKNSMGYTKHGFSVNLTCDTRKFDKIIACGIPDLKVTSLLEETGIKVTAEEFSNDIIRNLLVSKEKA